MVSSPSAFRAFKSSANAHPVVGHAHFHRAAFNVLPIKKNHLIANLTEPSPGLRRLQKNVQTIDQLERKISFLIHELEQFIR